MTKPLLRWNMTTFQVGQYIQVLAASLVAAAIFLARWYVDRPSPLAGVHAPMTVLIADLENRTNDPAFDRALEPVLRMSLESATFINAYDRSRINGGLGIRPPDKLDERAAPELAVKQGLNAVLSGSIDRDGDGYVLSITATHAVAGSRLASATGRAANKAQILQTAATLIGTVRKALGDDASDVGQLFAATTLSTTSLEAVREYAAAQDAGSNGRFDEALPRKTSARVKMQCGTSTKRSAISTA